MFASYCSQAQSIPLYLGISTGLENPTGIIGVHAEAPITSKISIGSGVGMGIWGTKVALDGKYYFTDYTSGWALGAGLNYSTGTGNYEKRQLINTDKTIEVKLLPVTTAYGSVYKYWRLGRNHKFYLQSGYALRLNKKSYNVKETYTLTNDDKIQMKSLAPGGFMFALGFSFNIAR